MKGISILFPVARLVMGSLYEPITTDAEGKPLKDKNGNLTEKYYFAIAIKKGKEQHWSETLWGKQIWEIGQAAFPEGQANSPTFAWKIIDGDSQIPNKEGKKPCSKAGHMGCWILNFSCFKIAPKLWTDRGEKALTEKNFITLGDFIEVFGNVSDNIPAKSPGVYLNHEHVCFVGYGEKIYFGTDIKSVGFGSQEVPEEASEAPKSSFTPPAPPAPPAPPILLLPYPGILSPKIMTGKANGTSYDEFIKLGWTDELLISNGYMEI